MKTLILCHGDCDGMCAGAVALSRFPDAYVFFTKPVSFYDDLKNTDADRVVIADIALTKQDARKTADLMKGMDSEILYFDHHIIPKAITKKRLEESVSLLFHERNVSASELIYRYYQKRIPKERAWVAIYGAIGDYSDDTDFVEKAMLNWDVRALYFEVSTIVMGIKNDEFSSYDTKRKIVRVLSRGENPSDIPGLVASAKEAVNREFDLYEIVKKKAKKFGRIGYVKDIHSFGFRGPSALFASTVKDCPVGLSVYTRERYLDLTLRARDERIPLQKLAEDASECVGGSGGGHERAAGARIPLGSFKGFLNAMNDILERLIKRKR